VWQKQAIASDGARLKNAAQVAVPDAESSTTANWTASERLSTWHITLPKLSIIMVCTIRYHIVASAADVTIIIYFEGLAKDNTFCFRW
jgi:hypothetical protein